MPVPCNYRVGVRKRIVKQSNSTKFDKISRKRWGWDRRNEERNCSLTERSEQTTYFWIADIDNCIIYDPLFSGAVFSDLFILSIFSWRRSTDSFRDERSKYGSSTVPFSNWGETERGEMKYWN